MALFMLLSFKESIYAADIWCNPNNIGIQNGLSKATGFNTLHAAFEKMSSGDKLIIAKGDWRKSPSMFIEEGHRPPNGSPRSFSKVWAEEDWNVKLPYIHIESAEPKQYIEFRGIVFDNEFVGKGIGHVFYEMNHTKFFRCGFLAHGLRKNNHNCGFGSGDSERLKNQYNLMEECIAWGSGRYVFYCKYGKYNIFRRCVARHDSNDESQMFNFRAYACDYTVYQNCISIDSDRTEHYAKPIDAETGGFWVGDQYGATGNIVDGCMSIKDIQMAYYISGSDKNLGSATVRNCIALDMPYKLPNDSTLCAFVLLQDENVEVLNVTGVGARLKGHDGIYCKKSGKKYVDNCIICNIEDEGVGINPSSASVIVKNIAYYNVGGGRFGEGSLRIDPFKHGLIYPIRIENGSELANFGRNKTVCGATILKKIGISGTLYGESGWDQVTDEQLWPFPNDTKIRELMRKTVDGISGIYGFCADGQTLSNYIWGYFGNVVPPFNVKAVPGDKKVTLKWDTPAEIAIDFITGFNVYRLAGPTKTLAGGTVAGNRNCSKTISGLRNGSAYEFAVTAIDKEKGESGLSYRVRVTPGKPEKLSTNKSPYIKTVQTEQNAANAKATTRKKFSNKLGMEFTLIPPGIFDMGIPLDKAEAPNASGGRSVTLTTPFYMQVTEVTQRQWKEMMGQNPSFFKDCGDDCPVEQVSWNDVQLFIKRLNEAEATNKYRLPTEAEWEYACRAGTETPFSFGKCLTDREANYNGEYPFSGCEKGIYRKGPISAKSFQLNLWGLAGMHGNVWEWCGDWLSNYPSEPATDPLGPSSGELRVIRGGGWNSYAEACRSGNRTGNKPHQRFANLGFRLVREP